MEPPLEIPRCRPRWAVPWLRRLVASLPQQMPGLEPGSVHVTFVADKLALGRVFLRVIRSIIISPGPHTHIYNHLGKGNRAVGGRSSEL
jgi:hypothetical protein